MKYYINILLISMAPFFVNARSILNTKKDGDFYKVSISADDTEQVITTSGAGLWAIATDWVDDWPAGWHYSNSTEIEKSGNWTILKGSLKLPEGEWLLRDAYKEENGMIKCIRRFEWKGDTLKNVTLAIKWKVAGKSLQAFLPGILYYGNPSGEINRPRFVPVYHGINGEKALLKNTVTLCLSHVWRVVMGKKNTVRQSIQFLRH